MTQLRYAQAQRTISMLNDRVTKSKAVRRKLMRKLCTDLNFKADTWELANNHRALLGLAISRVAYGDLTDNQKTFASKLLTY